MYESFYGLKERPFELSHLDDMALGRSAVLFPEEFATGQRYELDPGRAESECPMLLRDRHEYGS